MFLTLKKYRHFIEFHCSKMLSCFYLWVLPFLEFQFKKSKKKIQFALSFHFNWTPPLILWQCCSDCFIFYFLSFIAFHSLFFHCEAQLFTILISPPPSHLTPFVLLRWTVLWFNDNLLTWQMPGGMNMVAGQVQPQVPPMSMDQNQANMVSFSLVPSTSPLIWHHPFQTLYTHLLSPLIT